jgi:methionyl-tRNA synthetase
LVEYWNRTDRECYGQLGISFNVFDRTSSEENVALAQYFFKTLYKKGYIFQKTVVQAYCEYDRKFLPDRYVKGTCPHCGATDQYSDSCEECGRTFQPGEILDPHCAICGRRPVDRESRHYFFNLSQFSEPIRKWLEGNKNLQAEVKNYVLSWIREGLLDWDITRDIRWGVPVPLKEAEGKVLYNWFDNHLGYISTAQKYFAEKGIDGKRAWNDSKIYHFIGKDIVYHHYLFLPAMRIGQGDYKLPESIPTRGFLLLEKQKFSKSRGWYVSLREFLDKFPADYLRYYLAAITPYAQADVNFDWDEFEKRINDELIANIGNFIHRTLTFIWTKHDGIVPYPQAYGSMDNEFLEKIKNVAANVAEDIEKNELSRALRKVVEFSASCNQYFQKKKPWADAEGAKTTLYLCANAVRSLAVLLEPYTPFSADKLWSQLNLQGSVHEQKWDSASQLTVEGGHKINEPKVLFQKIPEKTVEDEKGKLHRQVST